MSDDLIFIGLIFIFIQEILCAGKSNLVNVLLHFFLSHANAVICHGNSLVRRVHNYLNLVLHILRLFKLPHQLQFL